MVQSGSMPYASLVEAARRGNGRAIATWLNQALRPYGMRARVGAKQASTLKLLVEFVFPFDPENPPSVWRDQLVRLICHRLWKLNSPLIQGVSITARFVEQPQRPVWRRSVRIVTPASRQKQHTSQLRSRIRQTAQRKRQLRTTRTLLVGGPAIAAVLVGGILGYTRAPVERTNANAATEKKPPTPTLPTRPDTVQAALETVPVVKHNEVANPQDPTVTLMFSGDVTLSDSFKDLMGDRYGQTFANMPEYKQADVAMVNLENPLTRATLPLPGKQFNFKADPEAIEVLKSGGVDIVTLANNHTMDYDAEGLKETLTHLNKAGIEYMGAGENNVHARRPQIIDVKGQRIAYLAYWGEEYGAEANKPGINNIREEHIAADIQAIRDQVDWVVVNYHWGQELADYPADWQVKLAHFTVDHGADLVVGHHPHVLQGAEIYKGRAIAYSLGNFIFGGNSRSDYDTAVLKVALKDRQMKVDFLPVEVKGYQPRVVQGDRGQDILKHVNQLSADFRQPMPTSTVLDARVPNSPTPTSPTANTPATNTPAIDSAAPPAAEPKAIEPPISTDPNEQDVLPGYGGAPVPMPSPMPSIDPLNPETYLEPAPATPAPAVPPIPGTPGAEIPAKSATEPSSETGVSGEPNPAPDGVTPNGVAPDSSTPDGTTPTATPSPQLPNFPASGNSFTTSPDSTPLNLNQAPPAPTENIQGSLPGTMEGNRSPARTISFEIQPKSRDAQTVADETDPDIEEPLQVALAAPMMW